MRRSSPYIDPQTRHLPPVAIFIAHALQNDACRQELVSYSLGFWRHLKQRSPALFMFTDPGADPAESMLADPKSAAMKIGSMEKFKSQSHLSSTCHALPSIGRP